MWACEAYGDHADHENHASHADHVGDALLYDCDRAAHAHVSDALLYDDDHAAYGRGDDDDDGLPYEIDVRCMAVKGKGK